jgi:hypothetical protein
MIHEVNRVMNDLEPINEEIWAGWVAPADGADDAGYEPPINCQASTEDDVNASMEECCF